MAQTPSDQWTAAQRTLAGLIQPGGADEALAADFAERRLAILRDRRARLVPADEVLRELVESGLSSEVSPALAQHRREVRALQRQLKWYVAELRIPLPDRPDRAQFRPIYDAPAVNQEVGTNTEKNTQAKPNFQVAAELADPEKTQTKPNEPEPTPDDRPQVQPRPRFEDLSGGEKAARVAARKRRVDPARAVAQMRRAERRSA